VTVEMSRRVNKEAAENLAIQALSFIVADDDRLGRFLALSGIDPASVRDAATQPGFLVGVLDHIAGDEPLLLSFASEFGLDPAAVEQARAALAGPRATDEH